MTRDEAMKVLQDALAAGQALVPFAAEEAFAAVIQQAFAERDGEIERLREHISEQIAFVETRVQDGVEMGAAVWRIALGDVARENRQALAAKGDSRG